MKVTIRTDGLMCQNASLHMVGQCEDMLWSTKVSDVARWLQVSKPTAKTYLEQWCNEGWLYRIENRYRSNALWFEYRLTPKGRISYEHKAFELSYQMLIHKRGLKDG